MSQDRKEYRKAYYKAHKEEEKSKQRAYYKAHKKECNDRVKAWQESHKEEEKDRKKAWLEDNKEEFNEWCRNYQKSDVNSNGIRKSNIRIKSWRYLKKYGKKIPGYEIHHCCSYTEPYKFIYCSKEMHQLIHCYLRQHNIDADSDHYDLIKHLLDDTVVLYGLEL